MRDAIARLMMEYVHAIDDDEVERWPGLFTDRASTDRFTDDYEQDRRSAWYCDTRGMLEDRVNTLREVNVFEPHVYRHVIGPTEILDNKDGPWLTQTSYLLVRTMHDGEMCFQHRTLRRRVVWTGAMHVLRTASWSSTRRASIR